MAGHERRRKVRSLLLAEAQRELGPNADALDYVCYRVENGTTMRELAREVTAVLDFVVRSTLVEDAAALGHEAGAATERIRKSRARGAHEMVEEGKDIIDNVAPDRDAIAKAKEQVNVRQFIAKGWNRADWGEAPKQVTNLSIGSLHIEALRSHKRARLEAQQISDAEVIEAEEITEVMDHVRDGNLLPGAGVELASQS
jgi:hypothetical protein